MKNEKDILKWFNNELSSQEIEDLINSENLQTLDKIAHYSSQMDAPKVDVQRALEEFKSRQISKKGTKVGTLNFRTFYRIAAVIAILLTSSYFLFFNNIKSFETSIAKTESIILPDDSEVVLNAKSKLTYNKKTWKNNRTLNLDGEAFFKVSKGQKFSVETDEGIVEVLGTQFNVKERDNYFEVQCYEGLVSVTHNNKTSMLAPGKTYRIINGQQAILEDYIDTKPAWLHKESQFVKVPLAQVIAELERQYNLKISTDNIDLSQLYTGTFTHTDANIALQSVTIPLKLSYKIDGKNVVFYNYEGQ